MGRHAWKHDYEVEDCICISIFEINRRVPFKSLGTALRSLSISCETEGKEHKDVYELLTTRCYFGGLRYWFKCQCGRRVAKLYMPPDSNIFRCRSCHNLTFNSRKREHPARIWRGMIRTIQ